MATERKRQSPYQRYGKPPYRYSDDFYRWERAAKLGNDAEARHFGAIHTARYGDPTHEATAAARVRLAKRA